MKKTYLAIALATATFFACNSGTSSNTADSTTQSDTGSNQSTMGQMDTSSTAASTQPVSDSAKQFMMAAAAGGNTEVAASQVALTMAKSDRVKNFANMM